MVARQCCILLHTQQATGLSSAPLPSIVELLNAALASTPALDAEALRAVSSRPGNTCAPVTVATCCRDMDVRGARSYTKPNYAFKSHGILTLRISSVLGNQPTVGTLDLEDTRLEKPRTQLASVWFPKMWSDLIHSHGNSHNTSPFLTNSG